MCLVVYDSSSLIGLKFSWRKLFSQSTIALSWLLDAEKAAGTEHPAVAAAEESKPAKVSRQIYAPPCGTFPQCRSFQRWVSLIDSIFRRLGSIFSLSADLSVLCHATPYIYIFFLVPISWELLVDFRPTRQAVFVNHPIGRIWRFIRPRTGFNGAECVMARPAPSLCHSIMFHHPL